MAKSGAPAAAAPACAATCFTTSPAVMREVRSFVTPADELDPPVLDAAQHDDARAQLLADGVDQALEIVRAGVLDRFGHDLYALNSRA